MLDPLVMLLLAAAPVMITATCSDPNAACWDTLCCAQPSHATGPYGCFRRAGHAYAQCRPLFGWLKNHSAAPTGTCTDTDGWVCPHNWLLGREPPPPSPPPPPPRASGGRGCHGPPAAHFSSCLESGCCQDPHGFGCFHRPDRNVAQCLPLTHQSVDGVCHDSKEWLCPATWQQPPPPPAAPPLPLPPRADQGFHRCHDTPSDHFAACLSSRCCKDAHAFGCFKKRSKHFAQCMPFSHFLRDDASGRCADNDEWLCPESWLIEPPPPPPSPPPPPPPFEAECSGAPRSKHFDSCLETMCCEDPHAFGCFKRAEFEFAQCRPRSHMEVGGVCVDTDDWLCPETWLVPPPPPPPSPPPPSSSAVVVATGAGHSATNDGGGTAAGSCASGTQPSAHFAACLESRCCADPRAFGCFKRAEFEFAQCRPIARQAVGGVCTDSESWICPENWMNTPPSNERHESAGPASEAARDGETSATRASSLSPPGSELRAPGAVGRGHSAKHDDAPGALSVGRKSDHGTGPTPLLLGLGAVLAPVTCVALWIVSRRVNKTAAATRTLSMLDDAYDPKAERVVLRAV